MKGKITVRLVPLAVAALFVLLDQLTKFYIISNFQVHESCTAIEGFLNFTYVQNTGAVGGILSDHRWIFMTVTAIVVLACLFIILSGKMRSKLMLCALTLVLAGGVGNMLDRIFRGYVIDFIDLKFGFLENFFIFNIADCLVVIGVICAMLYFIVDISESSVKKNKVK